MQNCPAPPMYVSANGLSGTIDRWHTTIYAPPGYCLIKNGAKPSGSNDPAAVTERRIINLITPETATSSHYFWSIARGYGLDDDDLTEHLRKATCFTFDQDARVLEAQQRSLGPSMDPVFPVSIRLDAGPTMARRLLKSAIAREAAAPH
jgi:vanillate O-demethylase monooxygenase subunit